MIEWSDIEQYTKGFAWKNSHKVKVIGMEKDDIINMCYIKYRELLTKYKDLSNEKFIEVYSRSISNMLKDTLKSFYNEQKYLVDIDIDSDKDDFDHRVENEDFWYSIEGEADTNLFISQIDEPKIKDIIAYIVQEGLNSISNEEIEKRFNLKPKKRNKKVIRIKKEIGNYLEKNFI